MSDQAPLTEVRYELRLSDQELARESEQWLRDHEASRVSRREQLGIVPLIPIIIAATAALSTLASLVMWIRGKTRCQQIIDARGEKIVSDLDCRIRDGRVVVITAGDVKVQLLDVPEPFDMGKVITAALSGGAEAVRMVAKAAGAQVEG